jgi:hypothetical protein
LGGGGWTTTRFDYYEQILHVTGNDPAIKQSISINIWSLIDTGFFNFPNAKLPQNNAGYSDWYGSFSYFSEPIQKGFVHIIRLDSIKGSIQGTFAFDLYSKDFKDTVHITDGRFFLNK